MINVLLYSKNNPTMTQVMADQLDQLGFSTEQTQILNLPRIVLNPNQVIHLIVDKLPLTMTEILCISAAKGLGKAVVISLLDCGSNAGLTSWVQPDALTVSQTNYLKSFREKESTKMILPQLFDFSEFKPKKKTSQPIEGFVFPLSKNLEEARDFKSDKPVYFDGRALVKENSSSSLRKKWTQLILDKEIPSHYHLILSAEKMQALLEEGPLALILASSEMKHTQFTNWLKQAITGHHLVILNQFQATGYSSHWTSGHNCLVLSSYNWLNELNAQMDNPILNQPYPLTDISKTSLDPLFNELSRLYTKIIYQKASLLESDSAKV